MITSHVLKLTAQPADDGEDEETDKTEPLDQKEQEDTENGMCYYIVSGNDNFKD